MSVAAEPMFEFENTYVHDLVGLYEPWQAAMVPTPELLVLNHHLATALGLDPESLRTPAGVAVLVGNAVPDRASPVAQAYAGHQFGGFSPSLGDGRALLVGELIDVHGHRRDLHLKGSGRTPFARGGDGKAAVGPMLREYVISEAMHALAVPTTRALAVVRTGEQIARDTMVPAAVLARIAASHLRVGTFQYAANHPDPALLQRLADHAIARHYPEALGADDRYLTFFDGVVDAQAALIARWMLVGFIHGVMNTDNMTISGETIDYGPCAFMDAYDPATVFSSIDHGGRYAYGNQPRIAQWNLARLAEAMLPLFGDNSAASAAAATEVLQSFPARYNGYWGAGMRAKLGLDTRMPGDGDGDGELFDDLLTLMHAHHVDFTMLFRALSAAVRGEADAARTMFAEPAEFDAWSGRWTQRFATQAFDAGVVSAAMDRVNPVYIARNHLVEEALDAATNGDLTPFHNLLDVLTMPYDERAGFERYARPSPPGADRYQTFCGT